MEEFFCIKLCLHAQVVKLYTDASLGPFFEDRIAKERDRCAKGIIRKRVLDHAFVTLSCALQYMLCSVAGSRLTLRAMADWIHY